MPYEPHQMLPDDLKDYAAPRLRPRIMEYVFAAIAAALALYAWTLPAPDVVHVPATVHNAIDQCLRWQDGLPLRVMVEHQYANGWKQHHCGYGAIDRRDWQ